MAISFQICKGRSVTDILNQRIAKGLTPEILAEIREVVALGMSANAAAPLLHDIAERHDVRKYRVRGTFRILTQEASNDPNQ